MHAPRSKTRLGNSRARLTSMGDLEYGVDELEGLGASLTRLAQDISNDANLIDSDLDHVCSDSVVSALNEFNAAWDDRRAVLVKALTKVGELASTSAQAFSEVDEDLAKKIREAAE